MKSANYFATVRNSPPCTRAGVRRSARPRQDVWQGSRSRSRGLEAVKTKTMRVTLPLCAGSVTVSGGSTMQRASCVDALSGRSSPLGADMVGKSRNSYSDVLFTQGLMVSIPPTIWCVRAQSVRDFVTEFSGAA